MEEPNYKIIELETENENLKDEIIKLLKEQVTSLQLQLSSLQSYTESDVSSNMIAPVNKPLIRTSSEARQTLERLSAIKVAKLKELGNA